MEEQEDATAFTTGFEKKAGIPRWETGIFRCPRELLAEAKEGTGPYSRNSWEQPQLACLSTTEGAGVSQHLLE